MPGAIDKGIFFAIALNNSEEINCYSIDFDESISLPLSDVKKMEGWKNYVLRIVNEFQKLNLPVKGFNCALGEIFRLAAASLHPLHLKVVFLIVLMNCAILK